MPRKPPSFDNHPASYSDATNVGLVRGICQYVSDGDTSDFLLDLGWFQYSYTSLRFKGINTPELRGTSGEEKRKAEKAKSRVIELTLNKPVLIKSYKDRTTFERFLGEVFIPKTSLLELQIDYTLLNIELSISEVSWFSLNEILISENLGEPDE